MKSRITISAVIGAVIFAALFAGLLAMNAGVQPASAAQSAYAPARNYYFGWYDNATMAAWIIIGNPSDTDQTAEVFIAGTRMGSYQVGPGERVTPRYAGVMNGPVKVVSTGGGELLVSQRITTGSGTFSEQAAVTEGDLETEQRLSWYDQVSPGMKSWIVVANEGGQSAAVDIYIGNSLMGRYSVPAGGIVAPTFPGVMNGPVKIRSTNGQRVHASQRVMYNGAFNEIGAVAAGSGDLQSEYYFTWYDTSGGMKTWVMVANQGSQAGNVEIYIGGQLMGRHNIAAGGIITPIYPGVMSGPVRVVSTSGQPLLVSQRSTYGGTFEEVPGNRLSDMSSSQWFAWYDSASPGMSTWILVANQGEDTSDVDVTIGGQPAGHYSVPAGGMITPIYPGTMNGPVEVSGTEGSSLLISQRVIYNNSFDEMRGRAHPRRQPPPEPAPDPAPEPDPEPGGRAYYVNPASGSDSATGAQYAPFRTIQKGVDTAQPGDTVMLAAGTYMQDVKSRRNGTAGGVISIKGPREAVVKGAGTSSRIIEINHDYLKLEGFTVDGLFGSSSSASGYRGKLIYMQGKDNRAGVKGVKITGMKLVNAGDECLRLRYFAEDNEITGNEISNCGVVDFRFAGGGVNGEAIYIGTAPEQLADGKNPTADADVSRGNIVSYNIINTQGNECVDIKEAATANYVRNNSCTGQKDPNSAGFDSRGSGNTFSDNHVWGSVGAGFRLGGDATTDGINNAIIRNRVENNLGGGIKFQRTPQGQVCGNLMSGNTGGNTVGSYGSSYYPTASCSY